MFRRLLGTGRGADTGPSADLRRTAMFAVWADEAALDRHLATTAGRPGVAERYDVRLRALGGHGSWRGVDVLGGLGPAARRRPDRRADPRRRPGAGVAPVPGRRSAGQRRARRPPTACSPSLGVGELPVGRLGTFSLWSGVAAMRAFAASPRHRDVVRRTRAERWYGEELFARFEPYGVVRDVGRPRPAGADGARPQPARHDRHEHPVRRPAEAVVQVVGRGEPLEDRDPAVAEPAQPAVDVDVVDDARTPRRRP